jgi:type VI secretion system protein ImpH
MISEKKLLQELRNINHDFKSSVVAGEIVDNGIPIDQIAFRQLSIFRRFISREIESVKWVHESVEEPYLVFETNKEGLYDMLPEALFHEARKKDKDQSDDKQIREQKLQEKHAREFFSPVENEFARRLLLFDIAERELHKQSNPAKNRQFFEYFFGSSSNLSDIQVLTLGYILPLSYKIRTDLHLIGITLSKILNAEITVTKQMCRRHKTLAVSEGVALGKGVLGVSTTLGDVCVDFSFRYEIHVHNVQAGAYLGFCTGGANHTVIDFVLPYFFPACSDVVLSMHPAIEDKFLKASDDLHYSFLGFNSYI